MKVRFFSLLPFYNEDTKGNLQQLLYEHPIGRTWDILSFLRMRILVLYIFFLEEV